MTAIMHVEGTSHLLTSVVTGYHGRTAVTDPDATWDSTLTLVTRARSGDGEGLDDLFARYLPSLRRWASGRLPRGEGHGRSGLSPGGDPIVLNDAGMATLYAFKLATR